MSLFKKSKSDEFNDNQILMISLIRSKVVEINELVKEAKKLNIEVFDTLPEDMPLFGKSPISLGFKKLN